MPRRSRRPAPLSQPLQLALAAALGAAVATAAAWLAWAPRERLHQGQLDAIIEENPDAEVFQLDSQ